MWSSLEKEGSKMCVVPFGKLFSRRNAGMEVESPQAYLGFLFVPRALTADIHKML